MTQLTPRRARAVARVAYLFTLPLVTTYRTMYREAVDSSASAIGGGFGTWRHTVVGEPRADRWGRPREDVVHSSVWLDLRSEPWSCSIGAVSPEVSFAGGLFDLWGFRFADCAAGHRSHAPVIVAGPTRVRDVPLGSSGVVHGESSFVVLVTETRWRDPLALPDVEPVRPDIVLEPASSHIVGASPSAAPAVEWWPWHPGVETTDEFWSCANFALSLTAPHVDDLSVLERISEIGVRPGTAWDPSAFSDEVLAAIRTGVDDALSDLLEGTADPAAAQVRPVRRSEMDGDYFARAIAALSSAHRLGVGV